VPRAGTRFRSMFRAPCYVWILLGGIITAIGWALAGIIFYITIVGIPLGRQAFKMAKLSLMPFGAEVRSID